MIPEWLEYWIAQHDMRLYLASILFLEMVVRFVRRQRTKRTKYQAEKSANVYLNRRNGH